MELGVFISTGVVRSADYFSHSIPGCLLAALLATKLNLMGDGKGGLGVRGWGMGKEGDAIVPGRSVSFKPVLRSSGRE
ncbi:MAG: hypothetical protein NW224_11755 [Leptolyngbyaceae cyanobacterium bins.302]|nr:hypothetical protein [Leptolyngbyaceae cyanobacterium bins.302]